MIDRKDLSFLAKSLSVVVREYVASAIGAMTSRLDEVEARMKAIPAGPKGDRGEAGERGLPGEKGIQGTVGPKGEKGDAGEKGEAGLQGVAGVDGKDGAPGPTGERGPQGERGIDGKDGAHGERGLPGEIGPQGAPGLNGKDGSPGERGIQGEKGDPGQNGSPGDRGPVGEKGIDGKDGRDGRDGVDGRDAAEIVIHEFDSSRSYVRGTFAAKDAGLQRFDGKDWQVIVRGVQSIETIFDESDPRIVTVKTVLTGGIVEEKTARIPMLVYSGIWKAEQEYQAGDVVTWDGSAWHCEAKSTKAAPGKSSDWKLMVKRGTAGKDASK